MPFTSIQFIAVYLLCVTLSLTGSGCTWGNPPGEPALDTTTIVTENPRIVQLSPNALKGLALNSIVVQKKPTAKTFKTLGVIKADEERIFHVGSLVSGRLGKVTVKLGDTVQQGALLANVENTEVPRLQATYIHELHQNEVTIKNDEAALRLAESSYEREKRLYDQGITPRKDLDIAKNTLEKARTTLQGSREHQTHIRAEAKGILGTYGVSTPPASEQKEHISRVAPIRAPQSGVVIEKTITSGDVVQPQDTLFTIANLNQVWLDVTLYPKQVNSVKMDAPLTFFSDSDPTHPVTGRIGYVLPQAEQGSETYIARAFLNNQNNALTPGMRGTVNIALSETIPQLTIPAVALHRIDHQNIVFKVLGKGRFQAIEVTVEDPLAEEMVVTSGLVSGDIIVTHGSFTLKAELLKDSLGEHGH